MCFLQDTIEYMTVGVCVNFMKKSFSQTVSEPEFLLSTYNITTDHWSEIVTYMKFTKNAFSQSVFGLETSC